MSEPGAGPRMTEEQAAAVNAKGVSIALTSGAGCGKTTVLSRRFLALLEGENPLLLSRIAALTFTDKAARELRQRIRQEARSRAEAESDRGYWRGIVRDLDGASIGTFHSFCGDVIRRFAIEIGVDPGFVILDATIAPTIHQKTLDACLRRWLASRDPDFAALAIDYGLNAIRNAVADFLAERPAIDIHLWASFTEQDVMERWRQRFAIVAREQISEFVDSQRETLQFLTIHPCRGSVVGDRCRRLIAEVPLLLDVASPVAALLELNEVAKILGGKKDDWDAAEVREGVKRRFEVFREKAKDLREFLEAADGSSLAAAKSGVRFARLVCDAIESYELVKRQDGLLDFNDLQMIVEDQLRDHSSPVAVGLRDSLSAVLVDEFQDTDARQARILEALAGDDLTGGRLFLVGDPKQSIYGFRGAEPTIFQSFRERFSDGGRLNLTANYRSSPAILHFVNALFGSTFVGVENALRAGNPHLDATDLSEPCIEFRWAPDGSEKTAEIRRKAEAESIAELVANRLKQGWWVRGAGSEPRRRATPGDVAILFRSRGDFPIYERALAAAGLEYHVVGDSTFYAQQEVIDILNVLATIEDPLDPLPLVGTLRSPFFGVSDEGLYWLAMASEAGVNSSFVNLNKNFPDLSEDDRLASRRASESLHHWRGLKDRVSIAGLLDRILGESGYEAALMGEFLGERKRANVRKLVDLARKFDDRGSLTLADFVTRLRADVKTPPREEQAATTDESGQAVRLMTIHQSKGLEFPIVILADLDRKSPNSSDLVTSHPDLGFLIRPADDVEEGSPEPRNLGREIEKTLSKEADRVEALRILYVATTRAKDHLLLSAGCTANEEPKLPALILIAERFDRATGACLDESIPPSARPLVRIISPDESVSDSTRKKGAFRPKLLLTSRRILDEEVDRRVEREVIPRENPRRLSLDPTASTGPTRRLVDRLFREAISDPSSCGSEDIDRVLDRAEMRLGELIPDRIRASTRQHLQTWRSLMLSREIASAPWVRRRLDWALAWPLEGPDSTVFSGRTDIAFRDSAGEWHLVGFVLDGEDADVTRQRLHLLLASTALDARAVGPVAKAHIVHLGATATCETLVRFDPSEIQRAINA